MSAVFQACVQEWMWLQQNPFRLIKKPAPGRRKMRIFSADEIKTIRELCAASNSAHVLPIFIIGLHTGMRKGEILSLRVENIDFKNKEIHLFTSKNGEPRDIAMTAEVYKTLFDLVAAKKSAISGLIFASSTDPNKPIDIKSTWERILSKAGIADANFHTLRHTTCSFLASMGIDRTVIARIVGHKDSRTTDIYIDLVKTHQHEVMHKLESLISAGSNA
jgi:integrase